MNNSVGSHGSVTDRLSLVDVIDRNGHMGSFRQGHEATDFRGSDNLISDQDVGHAVINKHFRFAQLCACHSHGTGGELPFGKRHAFMVLKVRT